MLCFDQATFDILQALKEDHKKKRANNSAHADLAKLRLTGELPMGNTVKNVNQEEVNEVVYTVKLGIKGFLRQGLHWTEPG